MKDIDADKNLVGSVGSPTHVVDVFMPVMERRVEILKGDNETVVKLLVEKLRRLGVI